MRKTVILLYSTDLELGETTQRIFEAIGRLKPQRVIIDSLSEIRLLAQSSLHYRRQILGLKHYFAQNQSTVILLDDLTSESPDHAVHSITHLDQLSPVYGGERRRLQIIKCRGQSFAAVITILRLLAAACGFSRAWLRPSVAIRLPARSSAGGSPSSMHCSAAGWPKDRAPS